MTKILFLPVSVLLFTLAGCISARIPLLREPIKNQIPPEVAHDLPPIAVRGVSPNQRVGTLFALLAIPVGSVVISHPEELLHDAITRAILTNRQAVSLPPLIIMIRSLTVSAFDLLLTRRISCTLSAVVYPASHQPQEPSPPLQVTTELAQFRSLAFSPQVAAVSNECFATFGEEISARIIARFGG
jgi:hypothetical protein